MSQLPAAARDQQTREAATVPVQLYACDRCGTVGIQVPKFDAFAGDWPACGRAISGAYLLNARCSGTMYPIRALLPPETP